MTTRQWKINSTIGQLYLVASEKGLRGIFWQAQSIPMAATLHDSHPSVKFLAQAALELKEYFAGQRKSFTIPLDTLGTPFQKQVWQELQKIPYGQTVAYKHIATQIKNPNAVRAVGSANGKNPVFIIVPCHRVIAADGSLGGFAGGLQIKTQLLALEQKHSRQSDFAAGS